MHHSIADLLARLDRWPRRLAASACLLLAAASAIAGRGRASPAAAAVGVRVVVATHDLGAGAVLSTDDLTTAVWPRPLVPVSAVADPTRLLGRRLAGPLRHREAVTATRLVGSDLTAGLAPGEVAATIRIDAGAASLLHPGDHVDVLAGPPDDIDQGSSPARSGAGAGAAILLAAGVVVLAVLPTPDAAGASGQAQLLIATDRGTALRILALQGRRTIAVVGNPP